MQRDKSLEVFVSYLERRRRKKNGEHWASTSSVDIIDAETVGVCGCAIPAEWHKGLKRRGVEPMGRAFATGAPVWPTVYGKRSTEACGSVFHGKIPKTAINRIVPYCQTAVWRGRFGFLNAKPVEPDKNANESAFGETSLYWYADEVFGKLREKRGCYKIPLFAFVDVFTLRFAPEARQIGPGGAGGFATLHDERAAVVCDSSGLFPRLREFFGDVKNSKFLIGCYLEVDTQHLYFGTEDEIKGSERRRQKCARALQSYLVR